ncbi:MAG: polysaccharide biosynthesis tyrosine autokinase [Brevundimonas sp.]|nr:MAG: polysaccharide biosynthesis tyrosine autokinase [Brevundimonas sp.]
MFGDPSSTDNRPIHTGASSGPAGANGQSDVLVGAPPVDIAVYWNMVLKHRFLLIGSVLASLAIGAALTLLMTPKYTAATTLQIDREAARVLNSEDVSPGESMIQGEEFFQTQYGLLRSRSLAQRVIESLGLARNDEALRRLGVDPSAITGEAAGQATKRQELALEAVSDNLNVSPVRGSRLVAISYTSPDPRLSATIANAFAENFIQSNLDRKFDSTAYARDFLEERLAQTKTRLEDAERQLVAYAANQEIITLDEPSGDREGASGGGESLTSRTLSSVNTSLAVAISNRIAAQQKWERAQAISPMSLTEVLQNQAFQGLAQERAKVSADYEQKLSTFQPEYPEVRELKARLDQIDGQMRSIATNIRSSIQNEYIVAANQERALQSRVNGLKGEALDLRDRSIQYNILQRELDTTRTLYEGLLARYKEVGVSGGLTTNNVSIVDSAEPPNEPSEPRLFFNMAIALLIGLIGGVVAALILEALDETLATPDDVEQKLGQNVLGVVPMLDKGETPIMALQDVRSGFSEAYYSLRTALQFSTADGTPARLLVTSSRPAEGKSTTAYATALNLARVGRRVLLVDGDLRNPSMHRTIGAENDKGMSNVLAGLSGLKDVIVPTQQENLYFIPCGPLPPNPAELWAGDRLLAFLEETGKSFDHVVIDGPPVLGFADAPLLASSVDGVLFVLESRGTRRGQARGALRRLLSGRAHLIGVVMTKFNAKKASYGYGYDYAYDYNYGRSNNDSRTNKTTR